MLWNLVPHQVVLKLLKDKKRGNNGVRVVISISYQICVSDWFCKSIDLFGLNLAHLYSEHYCLLTRWLCKFSASNKSIEQRNL